MQNSPSAGWLKFSRRKKPLPQPLCLFSSGLDPHNLFRFSCTSLAVRMYLQSLAKVPNPVCATQSMPFSMPWSEFCSASSHWLSCHRLDPRNCSFLALFPPPVSQSRERFRDSRTLDIFGDSRTLDIFGDSRTLDIFAERRRRRQS
jgi:hypothetical protein